MAKELKRRGFRFVGPTTAYAMMQACGLVDDHIAGLPRLRQPEEPLLLQLRWIAALAFG